MKAYSMEYLSGDLNIVINEDKKLTVGKLLFYDFEKDDYITFKAVAKCDDRDTYNETTGINIVKLKLAKQYHSRMKQSARVAKDELTKIMKLADADYEYSNKKLKNIEESLKKYGLNFY